MPTPKLSEAKRREIEALLQQGYRQAKVATMLGVSQGTVSNVARSMPFADQIRTDLVIKTAAAERDEWKTRYQEALHKLQECEEELEIRRRLDEYTKYLAPINIDIKKQPARQDATPVIVASDWHGDEVIDPRAIGGVNEYGPRIFETRTKQFWKTSAKLVKILSQDSKIDTMIFAALGDFLSGWIHSDLIQTNSKTPPEMILTLLDNFIGGLEFLLKELPEIKIHFVAAVGNHSRITALPEHKNRVAKSYEGLLYELLLRYFAAKKETRIQWQLPTGYFNWVTIYGLRIRFHHGDNIRYHGGVGGIETPLRKAIAQWNKARRADLDVMGHWHTRLTGASYVLNGSLLGYSQFSEALKCDYETARQTCFLLHCRYGKTAEYPILVQDLSCKIER